MYVKETGKLSYLNYQLNKEVMFCCSLPQLRDKLEVFENFVKNEVSEFKQSLYEVVKE